MRTRSIFARLLAPAAVTVAAVVMVSCDDPATPPTVGSIEPRIALIQPDSATRASLVLPLTTVRARTLGPTGKVVDLDLVGSSWRGSITGLQAGTYEVIIEGIAAGNVQYYGRIPSITVARGQRAQPTVPFAAAVPTVSPPAELTSRKFSQRITVGAVPNATGYDVEVSKSPTFASFVSQFSTGPATPLVMVPDTGVYYIRSRAQLPNVPSTSIPWSDDLQWTVEQAPGHNTAGTAQLLNLASGTPSTTTDRNLTSAKTEDWFEFDLRDGDSLFVSARAEVLADSSPLNTELELFRTDGTTSLATAPDSAAGNSDDYLVYVAERTERHKLKVSGLGAANARGHFELRVEMRRLPRAPSGLTATAASGTAATLIWTDESDNETRFRIERCTGAGCSNFVPSDSVPANITTFTVNGLTQGQSYRFRVVAVNTVGTSLNSPVAAVDLVGPTAPTSLTATTAGNTRINLAWADNASNETGYELERCTGAGCTTFANVATLPANVTAHVDSTAAYNTEYRYRVRAVNNVLPSAYSGEAAANTIPPATPTGLTATVAGPTSIQLVWTDVSSDETFFLIERCLNAGCTGFAQIDSVPAGTQGYTDSGVSFNSDYRYRIRARSAVTSLTYSGIAEANTRPPAAPTALNGWVVQGPLRVTLGWTDNSTIETGFEIQRCTGAGCSNFAPVDTNPVNINGADDPVVTGNIYRYRIVALGVAGPSAPSNVLEVSTVLPDTPTGLAATTISATLMRLSWTDASSNEMGFVLYRCTGAACTPTTIIDSIPSNVGTWDDSTTAPGESYVYGLRAFNMAGLSTGVVTATANTLPPSVPTSFNGSAISGTEISLSWTASTNTPIAYRVERCTGPACTGFTEIAYVVAPTTAYVDSAVVPGQLHRYRVRAQGAADVSNFTPEIEVSLEYAAPPATFSAVISSASQINLNWGVSPSAGVTDYQVQRCVGVGCTNFVTVATVPSNTLFYGDTDVSAGQTYQYRVASVNFVGVGSYTATGTVLLAAPAAPTGVTASLEPSSVRVSWTDNATNEDSYAVLRCEGVGCAIFTQLVINLPPGTTSYLDSAVALGTTYSYRVSVSNPIGNAQSATGATIAPFLAAAPSGLATSTAGATQVNLSWADNSTNETGFEVLRCDGVGCVTYSVIGTVAANVTAYSDATVAEGNDYQYFVRALSGFGASAGSNVQPANTRFPAAPSNLVATTLSNSSIRLTWTDNADNETQFSIVRCAGVGCTITAPPIAFVPTGTNEYTDTGLSADEEYTYLVSAVNSVGVSPPSGSATATTNLPAVPGPISAFVQSSGTSVILNFARVANATGYSIERCEGVGCTNFAEIVEVPEDGSTNFYVDLGLTGGATYRYRIAAVNAAGASAYTNEIRITVGLPAVPTGFTATLRDLFADLRWTDASDNEQTFELQRCTGVGCTDFVYIGNASTDADSAVDASIVVGNHYRYILRANNMVGNSAFTAPVDLPVFLPETPADFDAQTFSATQINLSWTDGGTNELGFIIERCQNAGCTNFAVRDTVPANTVTYADPGLPQNQTFKYRVRSFNAIGLSAYTAVDSAATNVPVAPDSLSALALASDEILLTWADQSNNETQFLLEFCDGPGCVDFGFLALLPANLESYNHTGLVAGESYSYRLQAVGSAGSSPFTAPTTTDTDSPTVVTGLSATTLGPTQVSLGWTDNSSNELGYVVERCDGACGAFTALDTLPRNATSFEDLTAVVDQSYQYRIVAFNNVGSVTSGTAAANTLRPAAPTNFRVTTVSTAQVDLVWVDASTNETQFVIERCVGAGCVTFDTLAIVGFGDTTYQDVSVTADESYTYRVLAANIAGASATAGPVTVTTFGPAAPASVRAVAVSPTEIRISWTDVADNELGYRIERCSGVSCNNYSEVGSVGAGDTTYTSTGLTTGLFYRHRVRAFNNAGTSAFLSPDTDPTGLVPPTAASGLTALTLSASEVRLAWNDLAANESGYRIDRCTGAGCSSFTPVDTVDANVTVFVDATAPAGVVLRYQIRTFNGVGTANASNTAQASTTVPNAPTAFTATANGQTLAQMSWLDQSADETGFVIERCLGASCSDFAPVDTVAAGVTTFDDPTVTGGNIYQYRVFAIGNGRSAFSTPATVSTILPPAPTSLVAVPVSNTIVSLTWAESATDETGFVVSRCVGVGCSNFVDIFTTAAGATSYDDTTAPAGETLTYQVRAVNPAGPSEASNAQTVGTFIPAIPTTLSAALVSATQIDLSWANPATDELGVIVERCEGAGCSSFAVIDTTGVDATTYSDASALAGVTYRYRVRAFNAAGSSGNTSVVTISTTVPDAPTGLMLNRPQTNSGAVGLTWTDVSNTETGYVVERCDGTGCVSFGTIATLGADATSYNDGAISLDTTYVYQVRAENVVGLSAPATFTVRTYRPAIATGLTATTVSATRIDLAWSVPDSGVSEGTAVEYCQGAGCSSFVLLDAVPNDASTFTVNGLNPGVAYRFQVVRENIFGTLGASAVAEASTDIPLVPSGVTATTAGASQIIVSWSDVSLNETAFVVERCDTDPCTGPWVELDSTLAGVETFYDNTVSVGFAYSYRVRARNGAGTSDPSAVATANTLLPETPTLTALRVTSGTTVDLEWTAASFSTSYIVERCDITSCSFEALDTLAALTFTDSTVSSGRSFEYRIRGLNIVGEGSASATLVAAVVEPATPGAPLIEAVSPTEVRIAWTDNSNNEDRFVIERCEGAGCTDFAFVDTVTANDTSYLNGGLVTGSKYEYQIVAVNAVGASAPSPATLIVMQEPATPQTLTATTTGPGQITVQWVDNSDNEAQFLLERCTGLTCTDFVQIIALPAGTQQYVDNGLSLNAVYRYQVRAINGVGLSAYSNIDNANTVLPQPATGLVATIVNGGRVGLSWTDNSANEAGFRIERCDTPGCTNFTQVAQVGPNVTAFANTGLTYGNTYAWRVRAANISGDAAPSNVVVANLTLTAPAVTFAAPTSRTAVDLSWTNSSGWQAGFQVLRCQGDGCDPAGGTVVRNLAANVFSLADTVPQAGFEYTYAVRAVTVNGGSLPGAAAAVRTPIELQNATFVTGISDGTTGTWRRYAFEVPIDALAMRVRMGQGGGDSDLYVKYNVVPTEWGNPVSTPTECVPYQGGTQDEVCNFTSPAAGTWYVSLFAFSPYFNNAVKVSLAERIGAQNAGGGGTGMPGNYVVAQPLTLSGDVSATHLGALVTTTYDAFFNPVNSPQNVKFGIYSHRPDNGGQPNTLLSSFTVQFQPGLNEYAIPELQLPAGQYWLAILPEFQMDIDTDNTGAATIWRYLYSAIAPVSYAGGLPASWPAADETTGFGVPTMKFFVRGFR